jgi:IclR family acetate operon transcriptional repressor
VEYNSHVMGKIMLTAQSIRSSPESDRILALFTRILRDQGGMSLRNQAASLGLPLSTAYRLVSRLKDAGLVRRFGHGSFSGGLELVRLTASIELKHLTADIARPHLRRLARQLGLTVHLGILEEDMVTYLVKEHGGGPELFTRSGTQLDAYCSAIGKVLLAALPAPELERYLGEGPLIPLTANTISQPEQLRRALSVIRTEGFAIDAEEVMENVRCVAVPIQGHHGNVAAAASVARQLDTSGNSDEGRILDLLRGCARRIQSDL